MATRTLVAALAAVLLVGGNAARADPIKFTWHGQGINVPGSSKCPGYTLDLLLNFENGKVWGQWQQVGRVVRSFEFPTGADGSFEGTVNLGASIMGVKGQASADSARMDMKGYCIFGGSLKRE